MSDIKQLVQQLQSDQASARLQAAKALAMLGEQAQAGAVALVHASTDPDEEVRNWATEALENLGAPTVETVESLINLASTSAEPDQQYFALLLIGRLGAQAGSAYSALEPLARKKLSGNVHRQLLKTLAKIALLEHKTSLRTLLNQNQQSTDAATQSLAERLLSSL